MRTRPLLCLCALAVLAALGCRSVNGLHDESRQALAPTADQAEQLRTEGLALYAQQPRTLVAVTRAARDLQQAARSLPNDYDAQWQAAQALAFLADNETRPPFRRDAAEQGIVFAKRGRDLDPNRVECQYWYAINVGWLADVDRAYGMRAVGEMETALKRAIEIDERYDYAGPLRVLGILYLRTPAPPVSIGSPHKGLRLLNRAVDLFPDYPENYLYLAEALRENNRAGDARAALGKVLEAKQWPDLQFESVTWKAGALKLLQSLPAK